MTGYRIKQTSVEEGKIRYLAENDEGDTLRGIMTDKAAGPNTVLSQDAMEELAEQMVGKEIEDRRCSQSGGDDE